MSNIFYVLQVFLILVKIIISEPEAVKWPLRAKISKKNYVLQAFLILVKIIIKWPQRAKISKKNLRTSGIPNLSKNNNF